MSLCVLHICCIIVSTVGWTWWNWSLSLGPIFLQCFDTVGWVIWPVKPVPDMTYNVFGGTLNPAQSNPGWGGVHLDCWCVCLCYLHFASENPDNGEQRYDCWVSFHMIRIGVSWWMFLLVLAHQVVPDKVQRAIKQSCVACVRKWWEDSVAPKLLQTKFCTMMRMSKYSWWVAHQGQSLLSIVALSVMFRVPSPFDVHNFNPGSKRERLIEVMGSHVHCKSGNILEIMHMRGTDTIDH